MDKLIFDVNKLPEILKGSFPLFITMPEKVLFSADKKGVVMRTAGQFNASVLTYSGSALPVEDVNRLYEKIRGNRYSHVVAVGGGTVIDIAKIIAIALSNCLSNVEEILTDPSGFANDLKLIFIPTTCGTGSEATHFAVVYKNMEKYSVAHQTLIAEKIILDYRFLLELPEKIRNATVLDALSQAIESIWAKNGTVGSEKYAKEAIKFILKGLDSEDKIEKLKYFQKGSYLAGEAINISKTTASHAISYPLTAKFGIPHGIAVFLTLPEIAELNYCESTKVKFRLLFSLFKVNEIRSFKKRLENIMMSMGYSLNLADYGVAKSDLRSISVQSIVSGRSDNNPVEINEQKILEILKKKQLSN
jgi:alcohol dehydrogenase class IV